MHKADRYAHPVTRSTWIIHMHIRNLGDVQAGLRAGEIIANEIAAAIIIIVPVAANHHMIISFLINITQVQQVVCDQVGQVIAGYVNVSLRSRRLPFVHYRRSMVAAPSLRVQKSSRE